MSQADGSLLCSTEWMTCGGERELKEGEPSASQCWVMMCSILPSLWEPLGWVSTSQQSRPSNSACSGPQPPPHSAHTYNTHTHSLAFIHSLHSFGAFFISSLVSCHLSPFRITWPAISLLLNHFQAYFSPPKHTHTWFKLNTKHQPVPPGQRGPKVWEYSENLRFNILFKPK